VKALMEHPELKHSHDLLFRRFMIAPELMADLLKNYLENLADQRMVELLDLTRLKCENPVTVNDLLVEFRGDVRFSTSFKGSKRKSNVFVLLEHQSTQDPDFQFRGLEYIVQKYKEFRESTKGREKFPFPLVVILYHGATPWTHLPKMDELIESVPGMPTGLLNYPLILIDISELRPEQFRGHPVLQVLLELLQLASKNRLVAEFERVIERLKSVRKDPRIKYWLTSISRYALAVAKVGKEQIANAFSKIVNKKEAYKMVMTTAEELLVQGRTEGRVEGETVAWRKAVLLALGTKFGSIPKGVEKAILSKNDPIVLESLAVRVDHCKSVKEFAEGL